MQTGPLKRPNANELFTLIDDLWDPIYWNKVDSVIYRQLEETDDITVYISKLLDFKDLLESKNADNDDLECSEFLLTN
ncbi:kinase-like domain-containing protein [Rhizophagus irregularis DAOM 181602=DAOM 197198]|uniref:Uncharacterized protein n=1 Tax=Rhizophagus irregularis (strain DAOM 181602 / DAOM 197198 / MUCL 43194) TaxID=747089 RepID=A0A2P4QFM8_RHIID|nr:hypothetical protein GLOIN_2v1872116 [Rhizophagus irregularis DAOM 181602=DAOM 197198]POG76439.1 hypothetical protein GLOIN_2v1872116 [Rhizophagus irregularis DAOM 181602=DAOM 197198]GBC24522.2 kinase-like domain-containing protein [Rhizophagus irregularis DAOM 181602=DAOM 197198]|eukprot:XP_025183305.1 hypothetical protein GLOIN_2v1872116 [Rhizophagus irregularis DAOM 181602=DAOM 197198]